MGRPSRTYALRMSPAGVELFLDCHHRLCRLTHQLLPYGQTLFAAMMHLSRLDAVLIMDDLATFKASGLAGRRNCFVGAPSCLMDVVSRISTSIAEQLPDNRRPIMTSRLFIVALRRFRAADSDDLLRSYELMVEEAGPMLKIPKDWRDIRRSEAGH
ncbi:hypothetical protein [Sphingobium sp. TKS]|uniref:hypothetical protein n=2 Tax=Sphingomonadaceae TaxID=41297 RepID=UPI00083767BD|nr:hypothetical protein [Sphingobium sp. TKS]